MKRFALGVAAALLVVTAGSAATATPSSRTGDWCEQNADAGARPEVEKSKPVAAGGGRRDAKAPNGFACVEASSTAGGERVEAGAVVNAWADHENGALRLSCVPQGSSSRLRRCNEVVRLPAKADAAPPDVDVTGPGRNRPASVDVDDQPGEPLVSLEVEGHQLSVDHLSTCVEVDRTPFCRENPEGR